MEGAYGREKTLLRLQKRNQNKLSSLVGMQTYRHLNNAFLAPHCPKDGTSLTARFDYLMKVVDINQDRVKGIFVKTNKKEL